MQLSFRFFSARSRRKEIQYRGFKNKMWNAIQYRSNRRSGGKRQGDREGGIHTPRWFPVWGNAVNFFLNIIFVTAGRNQIWYRTMLWQGKRGEGINHSIPTNNKNNTRGDERRRKITRVKTKRNETNTNSDRDTEVWFFYILENHSTSNFRWDVTRFERERKAPRPTEDEESRIYIWRGTYQIHLDGGCYFLIVDVHGLFWL